MSATLAWIADHDVDARTALARGAGTTQAGGVSLYGAIASDDALVLGRWQRGSGPRRATGGPSARMGLGVLYLALGLPHPAALMECPPDRILNRNVRGFLGGLTTLAGEPVLYFGREWLSRGKTPIALIAWHRDHDGHVLIEAFVSIGAPFAPPRDYRGHTPGSIAPRELDAMVEAIASGHATRFPGTTVTRASALPTALPPPSARDDVSAWSAPAPVPIGIGEAGATLDDEGRFARVRFAGDFFADERAIEALETDLVGVAPDEHAIGRTIDHVLGPGRGVIEGVTSLRTLRDALLDASRR
ncbi:hypothetical protein [Sandaracinus amylolyticus]|uniref:Lipoate--protein ligase n=1 Tax=Sandaracinus amylolyticus TaxID=927083 RepID=A0A0F6YLK1_9BACT|nr:hypothetical protein [Sandaracinus amylolyticus]AKF09976.1 hypothetical protein DB32_007125 [Sandaracinus amylolyticus]